MYRIVIVEDSLEAADALRTMLERYAAERDAQFRIEHLPTADDFIERRPKADLIFMDIEMPGADGMEAAEALRSYDSETLLIFVTNLAQYALHGYAVDALDFIVKPVGYDDLCLRMDRAMRQLARKEGGSITLPTASGLRIVALRDLVYVDILNHDLLYHVAGGGEPLRLRGSIKAAAEGLGDDFVRISSSCLVNMGHVKLIRQNSVVLSDDQELFFSRGCRKEALETLSRYAGRSI